MPVYEYLCSECNARYDTVQSIRDDSLVTCQYCHEDGLSRVLYPPIVLDATPKTIGSQADKNSVGRTYYNEKLQHDHAESKKKGREKLREMYPNLVSDTEVQYERPYWRDSDTINTRLSDLTPAEKQNYILTGKTTDPLTPEITS